MEMQSELKSLRERHQITILQLTDLKQDNGRLKKINTTLVQNLTNQTSDPLTEIKLIIQGDHYHLRIAELESEIQKLNSKVNDEVQRRVKAISDKMVPEKIREQCLKCKEGCQKCKLGCEKCHRLENAISQKNDTIDRLRLDIEELKADLEIMASKTKNPKNKVKQLETQNHMLNQNIQEMQKYMIDIDEHQNNMQKLEKQWKNRYSNLNEQHQLALEQIGNLFRAKQQGGVQTEMLDNPSYNRPQGKYAQQNKQNNRETQMKKKIQSLAGQIASRKSHSPINAHKTMKPNAQSRLMTDSDYSAFSIKDAINRPSQVSFY